MESNRRLAAVQLSPWHGCKPGDQFLRESKRFWNCRSRMSDRTHVKGVSLRSAESWVSFQIFLDWKFASKANKSTFCLCQWNKDGNPLRCSFPLAPLDGTAPPPPPPPSIPPFMRSPALSPLSLRLLVSRRRRIKTAREHDEDYQIDTTDNQLLPSPFTGSISSLSLGCPPPSLTRCLWLICVFTLCPSSHSLL